MWNNLQQIFNILIFVQSESTQWNCKTLAPPGGQTLLPPSEQNSNHLLVCHSLILTLPYLHIIVTAISNFLHVPCLFITHCSWTFQRMGPTAVKAWKMEFMSAHFNGQSSNAEVVGVTFEICYYQFVAETNQPFHILSEVHSRLLFWSRLVDRTLRS